MKKLLSVLSFALLLTVAMSCAALPASAEEQADSIVGCWEAYAFGALSVKVDASSLSTLFLWEDGTAFVTMTSDQGAVFSSGSWTRSDNAVFYTSEYDNLTFQYTENQLALSASGLTVYYHKVPWPMDGEPATIAGSREDYLGSWKFCAGDGEAFGYPFILPATAFTSDHEMIISSDSVLLMLNTQEADNASGSLFIPSFDGDGMYLKGTAANSNELLLPVPMYENGWISIRLSSGDARYQLYFSRVPDEGQQQDAAVAEPTAKPSGFTFAPAAAKDQTEAVPTAAAGDQLRYDGSYCWPWINNEGDQLVSILHFAPDGQMVSAIVGGKLDDLDHILRTFSFLNPDLDPDHCLSYTFNDGTVTYYKKNDTYGWKLKLENGILRSAWKSEVYGGKMVTEEYVFHPFK